MEHSELLKFALDLVAVAEREILPRFQACTANVKGDGTVVTEADRVAEYKMREMIKTRYPSHGIIGEELGETYSGTDYLWLIDPIDGTTNYNLGVAKFGTLVGLLTRGNPSLGVIHLPITHESLFAEDGKGCWYVREGLCPRRTYVENTALKLRDAIVSLSGVEAGRPRSTLGLARLTRLFKVSRQLEFVGDCVQYALLARGRIHAALDFVMKPWDLAAIVPCIREAGGVVSTLSNDDVNIMQGGSFLASCNATLHKEILATIKG